MYFGHHLIALFCNTPKTRWTNEWSPFLPFVTAFFYLVGGRCKVAASPGLTVLGTLSPHFHSWLYRVCGGCSPIYFMSAMVKTLMKPVALRNQQVKQFILGLPIYWLMKLHIRAYSYGIPTDKAKKTSLPASRGSNLPPRRDKRCVSPGFRWIIDGFVDDLLNMVVYHSVGQLVSWFITRRNLSRSWSGGSWLKGGYKSTNLTAGGLLVTCKFLKRNRSGYRSSPKNTNRSLSW